jgi:AraC-like DNA-binding protein
LVGFAVQFTPAGAHDLLGIDVSKFQNATVALTEVLGATADTYVQQLHAASGFAERCRVTDAFFRRWLEMGSRAAGVGATAAEMLALSHGRLEVEALAQQLGLSVRTLLRRFTREVGVSPKHYARLLRFKAAHAYLQDPAANWADAVLRFGYTDQSHLIRDYRDFAGETPRQYSTGARSLDRAMINMSRPGQGSV